MAVINITLGGTTDVSSTDTAATLDVAALGTLNITGVGTTVDVTNAVGLGIAFDTYIGGGDTEILNAGIDLSALSNTTLGETVGGAAVGGSTLEIGDSGSQISLLQGVAFEGGNNRLIFDNGTSANVNVLSSGTLSSTDAIVLKGVTGATQAVWSQNTVPIIGGPAPGGTLELENAGGAVVGSVVMSAGSYAADAFNVTSAPGGGVITGESVACFHEGTLIAAEDGEVPVEQLAIGDRVRTADGRLGTVRWLGRRRIRCERQPNPAEVWPVCIEPGAFAPGVPRRRLLLSQDHAVFTAGNLVPIRYLVNGSTIRVQPQNVVTYWHIELEHHDVIFAEGLTCESYLDTGNRDAFESGGGVTVLHPDFSRQIWATRACAHLVLGGKLLERERQRLLERAEALGHHMTTEPRVRLATGSGAVAPRKEALGATPGRLCFDMPRPDEPRLDVARLGGVLRLMSRSAVPADLAAAPGGDGRRLGVAISRLLVNGEAVALDDPRLGAGWHAPEMQPDGSGWRWTDGEATLDFPEAREVEVEIAIAGSYWDDGDSGGSVGAVADPQQAMAAMRQAMALLAG